MKTLPDLIEVSVGSPPTPTPAVCAYAPQTRRQQLTLLPSNRSFHFAAPFSKSKRVSGSCDLFVDSFVYGAHTTAADALWAGLPLLTLRGYGVGEHGSLSMLGDRNATRAPKVKLLSACSLKKPMNGV